MTCRLANVRGRRIAILLLLTALLTGLVGLPMVSADPTGPNVNDRAITLAVVDALNAEHLLQHPLDNEISERFLKEFLKALDPWKVYFYQIDIDEFDRSKDELDDMARKGDIKFGYRVFQRFLQRVDERVKMVDEILAGPLDFTKDEEMISDRDDATYARTVAEARDKWRKRIKYELLVLKADGTEGQEAKEKIARRYQSFAKRMHQTDNDELLEMYLTSMTTSYDPHTTYMSPGTLENFRIMMRLELEGIGASLQSIDGYTVVKKIIPGGAADREGSLKLEDKIVGVGQDEQGEIVDTVDMKLSDVVKLIRGKRNTKVRLEVVSVDDPERKVITIVRDKIELKDEEAQGEIFEAGQRADGRPYRVGVIDLPSFYMDMEAARAGIRDFRSTTRDVRKILEDFNEKAVDAVVLDLRYNGGGSLTEAINLTGLFIENGPVVQIKGPDGKIRVYEDYDRSIVWSGPLVVLTSKLSASASEILAGAIKDYHRGLIVGDPSTHGKGTVQSLKDDLGRKIFFGLPNTEPLGALKITMQQFYRPKGDSTQKHGVAADVTLPSLTAHLDVGESDLDYPIDFDQVDPLPLAAFRAVDPATCAQLQQRSDARCKQSEDFQKVVKNIARYLEQKQRKKVTLNEEKFLKERAEMNAEKEEQETLERINDPNKPAIERDYYLDEALAIVVDYLNLKPPVARAN